MVKDDPTSASMPAHSFQIRGYYEDTDAAGIVYYANYLKFAERARTEMLRSLGIDHRQLRETLGLAFVVKSCGVDYHRPAHLDDLLDIHSVPKRLGGASLDLAQRIFLDDQLLVSLEVRLALLDGAMKPARVPPPLIAAFRPQYRSGN